MRGLVVFLLGLVLSAIEVCADGQFGWPIEIQPALSSTFAETRSTAFHAGIDVKTWGRTGYAVRALADGYIWRLRTSPWGYGRVVYQKLEDGRILVHAHLDRFAEKLARRVEEAQQEKGFYSVDVWLRAGEIPIKKGEVIAWTGQSGIGAPHLHLELRDAESRPINPLLNGFEVEDTTAPTIRSVALIPFGRESRVNNGHEPVAVALRWDEQQKVFASKRDVAVYGTVGIAALTYDRADAAPNKLAPYRTRLVAGEQEVFSTAYERYSYDDAHQVKLDRTRLGEDGGNYFNLFRRPGNRLEFYSAEDGNGLLDCGVEGNGFALEKGRHRITVEAADAAGNVSRAQFRIRVDAPPHIAAARITAGGDTLAALIRDGDDAMLEAELARSKSGKQWRVVERRKVRPGRLVWRLKGEGSVWSLRVRDGAGGESLRTCAMPDSAKEMSGPQLTVAEKVHPDFVLLSIRVDRLLAEAPRVASRGSDLSVHQVGLRDYQAIVPLENGSEKRAVEIEVRGTGGESASRIVAFDQREVSSGEEQTLAFGEDVELDFPRGSVYEPFFPQVERFEVGDTEDLKSLNRGYVLEPSTVDFDKRVAVALRYPAGIERAEQLGVYRENDKGEWGLAGNELDGENGRIIARVRALGRFALMLDETPPIVEGLYPQSGAMVDGKNLELSASIDDLGAGIGREEDIAVELDGRRVISVYDPEAKRVDYPVKEPLAPGAHELVVRVKDLGGNETTARSAFTVR